MSNGIDDPGYVIAGHCLSNVVSISVSHTLLVSAPSFLVTYLELHTWQPTHDLCLSPCLINNFVVSGIFYFNEKHKHKYTVTHYNKKLL